MKNYAELLFVDEVRELQDLDGTGEKYANVYPGRTQETLRQSDIDFIAARESFYMSSVSSTGWPYVQHRGGPKGFLKVLGKNRLGFADYRGNRQFISMGHVKRDDRVALILMDYENRARLKILGHLCMSSAADVDRALLTKLATPGQGKVERVAILDVVAIDWNCPQFIPQFLGQDTVQRILDTKLNALQEENAQLLRELEQFKS